MTFLPLTPLLEMKRAMPPPRGISKIFKDLRHQLKYSAEHVHPKFAQHVRFHSPCCWRHGGPPVASPVKWTAAASRRRRLVNRRRIPPERRRRASWRHEQRLMRAARRSLGLISAFLHNEIAHSAATVTDPVSLSFNGDWLGIYTICLRKTILTQ